MITVRHIIKESFTKYFLHPHGAMFKTLTGKQERDNLRRRVVIVTAIDLMLLNFKLVFAAIRGALRNQVIHVILHPVPQGTLNHLGHGGCHGLKVEVGVEAKEMTEDTRRRPRKKVTTFLVDKLVQPLRAFLKTLHDPGEEVEVAGVIRHERARNALIANTV